MSKSRIRQLGKFRISLEALRCITERNSDIKKRKEIQQVSIGVLSKLMGGYLSDVISDMVTPWNLFDGSMQPYTCSAIKKNWIKR